LVDGVRKCLPGVRLLAQHEDDLVATRVVGSDVTFLPDLERALLDLARSNACYGLMCVTLYNHGDFKLARVIEHGCLMGMLLDSYFFR
jgi:hypothetical protein